MGVFSEMDWELREQAEPDQEQGSVSPFTLDSKETASAGTQETFEDDAKQQAEADTAQAALSLLTQSDTPPESEASEASEDQKRKEHEVQEEKRKAEWEAKQAAKKESEQKAMQEVLAMTDDAVMDASVKRLGLDAERLTRRNMKMCVTEYVQTLCLDNPEFARKALHPRKSMMNCFKYINRHAHDYLKQEMEDNDERPIGYAMGGDVPDDLCYTWAEEYFNNLEAEEDKEKEEKFVPKSYSGSKSSSKKKKEPVKKKEVPKPAKEPAPPEPEQMTLQQITLPLMGA